MSFGQAHLLSCLRANQADKKEQSRIEDLDTVLFLILDSASTRVHVPVELLVSKDPTTRPVRHVEVKGTTYSCGSFFNLGSVFNFLDGVSSSSSSSSAVALDLAPRLPVDFLPEAGAPLFLPPFGVAGSPPLAAGPAPSLRRSF